MRTQSVTSFLAMQGFAITRIEHTHRKGRSAVILYLGRTDRGYRARLWPDKGARNHFDQIGWCMGLALVQEPAPGDVVLQMASTPPGENSETKRRQGGRALRSMPSFVDAWAKKERAIDQGEQQIGATPAHRS